MFLHSSPPWISPGLPHPALLLRQSSDLFGEDSGHVHRLVRLFAADLLQRHRRRFAHVRDEVIAPAKNIKIRSRL